jgi:hypothetical protein
LDFLIRESLLDFVKFVARTDWRGREREAVSLYAFGFLVPKCNPHTSLRDPTQIGVEGAVRQHPGPRRKKLACKDIVIWPIPAGTCWDKSGKPTQNPLAILEWKTRTDKVSARDEDWLKEFSEEVPSFTGYAISLNPSGDNTTMTVTQVRNGLTKRGWLHFPS